MSPNAPPCRRTAHTFRQFRASCSARLTILFLCVVANIASGSTSISVGLTPHTASVFSGLPQQFTASVNNSSNQSVTWSTSKGRVSSTGLYTAPTVSAATTVTVTATSAADPTKSPTATVTVNQPVGVSISPTSITLESAASKNFKETITGTSRLGVTWSATKGSITSSGTYTAPTVNTNTIVSVKATSVADPLASASSQV